MPNFETVVKVYEDSKANGQQVEVSGTLKIIVKGLIFTSDDGSKVRALFAFARPDRLSQVVQAPLIGLLFVGGYKPDKTVFAVVIEDAKKERTCHVFKWSASV